MTKEEQDDYRMKIIFAKMSGDAELIQSALDSYIYALEKVVILEVV